MEHNQRVGEVTITREQFTRWDEENFPQFSNSKYLELENRSSSLSKNTIISYGYKRKTYKGNGVHSYEWLKIDEAKDMLHVLSKFPNANAVEKIGYGLADFDGFVIFSELQDSEKYEPLGTGETQAEAWEQAATRVGR